MAGTKEILHVSMKQCNNDRNIIVTGEKMRKEHRMDSRKQRNAIGNKNDERNFLNETIQNY